MTLSDLIEALDQRYGNPYAAKECGLIQEAISKLKQYEAVLDLKGSKDEDCNGK
jgi:hypothetical protein